MRKAKIEKEKAVVLKMIEIYCKGNHGKTAVADEAKLCPGCGELYGYAVKRLSECGFGENKGNCSDCPVRCYNPLMKDEIKKVMRYAGPRMIKEHPIMTIEHLWRKMMKKNFGKTKGKSSLR